MNGADLRSEFAMLASVFHSTNLMESSYKPRAA